MMVPAWYDRFWWKLDYGVNITCTVEERERVLLSSLALLSSEFLNETADVNRTTTTGIVSRVNVS